MASRRTVGAALSAAVAVVLAVSAASGQGVTPVTTNVPEGAAAIVNGEIVPEKELVTLLMQRHGRTAVQQLVMVRLIEQEMKKRGLEVTDKDVEAHLAKRMAESGGEAAYLKRVAQSGVTLAYVKAYELRTELALIKLTEKDTTVTDEDVKKAFEANYGEKRQVRRIEVDGILIAADVIQQLKNGADFVELVKKHSVNARAKQAGGLSNPFGRGQLPAALKEIENVAFELEVGKVSEIVGIGERHYVIKLEAIVPARTDVKLADIRDKLVRALHTQKVTAESSKLIQGLRAKARIAIRARA